MSDVAAVRDRLRELNSLAERIPAEALTHFAFALPDDLDRVAYLDVTIEQSQAFAVPIYYGSLVALTDAGLMVQLAYDDEEVWPLDMQPLRGP